MADPQRTLAKTPRQPTPEPDLKEPGFYFNRELSLLAFQRRVLEEAQDPNNPLLERLKFLSIVGSNLDPTISPTFSVLPWNQLLRRQPGRAVPRSFLKTRASRFGTSRTAKISFRTR